MKVTNFKMEDDMMNAYTFKVNEKAYQAIINKEKELKDKELSPFKYMWEMSNVKGLGSKTKWKLRQIALCKLMEL